MFVTKTGRPLDRSHLAGDEKAVPIRRGSAGGGSPQPAPPVCLDYYSLEKDLFRLADILGHSSASATHIYTVESGTVHARQQLARIGLITTQGQLCCWEIGVRHLYGAKFHQINSRHPREIEKQAQKTKSVEGHFSPASFSWASLDRHP